MLYILPTSSLAGRHPALLDQTTNDNGAKNHFMTPDLNSRPRLAAGCRLNDAKQQPRVLLMPERALRLNGPSLEIVERCDGRRTVRQIITELQKIYDKADPQKVESDILGYLSLLNDQRALDFVGEDASVGDSAS
jgi:pyrroloquinoline quinone biosynthesis protein D